MKTVAHGQFENKVVLIRVDFNVPIDAQGRITDDLRIKKSLPTIRHILTHGGAVVLMSHLGRPKNGPDPKYSLKPVQTYLAEHLQTEVLFCQNILGEAAHHVCRNLMAGDVVLLENLRFYPEEEKGDENFARELATLADVYVNDAFGSAHRAHASTTVVAKFFHEKYAGFLLAEEVKNAKIVLEVAQKPFVALLGGAKVSDKIEVITNLLPKLSVLAIGGGMSFTFLKSQGYDIGTSLYEPDKVELAKSILVEAQKLGVQVLLPKDVVVAPRFEANAPSTIVPIEAIPADQMGLDLGPESISLFRTALLSAKTVLWNGPMGVFEFPVFAKGTFAMASALADATIKGAYTLVGGGDSAAAVEQAGFADKVSYVSTGGGALLEYLEGKVLPGVAALNQ